MSSYQQVEEMTQRNYNKEKWFKMIFLTLKIREVCVICLVTNSWGIIMILSLDRVNGK